MTRLLCVGLNWKTPVQLRERLAFDGEKLALGLAGLRQIHPAHEFAIVSTCNRTEIYAGESKPVAADGTSIKPIGVEDLCEFLANFHGLLLSEFYDHLYFHEDAGAVLHLFSVTSGLDSLVLGEGQILGQVKQAYQISVERQTAGRLLHALFQGALAVAKRVQSETALSKGRLSMASAAVDYIRGVFDTFSDKTVLVIGAGKMAELTLTHLAELKPGRLRVLNRSIERAEKLAAAFGGESRSMDDLHNALVEADIVISSTGAEEPIVRAARFGPIMNARKNRLMAIVDIAVPRDFDVAIGKFDNVLLWNIDDLEKVRYKTLRSRERELDNALKIIDAETASFEASLAMQQSGPVIGRLEEEYQRIMEQELEWLMPQLNGIPDQAQAKIRQFAHRLKNKFLHPPKAAIREEALAGRHHGLLDALRRLFRI